MSALKVGGKIWRFDGNRRVYPKRIPGEPLSSSAPIYREHWHEVTITGETSRSWVTAYGKCPKRGGPGWALNQQQIDDDVFVHDCRHKVRWCIDDALLKARLRSPTDEAELLRAIFELLGVKPESIS